MSIGYINEKQSKYKFWNLLGLLEAEVFIWSKERAIWITTINFVVNSIYEELGAKTAQVTIFGDLKILGLFSYIVV